jgi:murein DD-endopeptidase MepM/ murein hydrolase activator NlpD
MSGVIRDNLVSAIDDLQLALDLTDIFAWDIDFTTDLRKGDTFRLMVEELWLGGAFKRYGKIVSAEFVNDRRSYHAYRFELDGEADYYDRGGKSLRRAFLKAPLSYRRISARYTKRRYHPVLKTYRPHLGIDYAAPRGTPVSSVGDGTVVLAAYRGANGRQVVIKHPGGYKTYYGHLSRIKKGIRKGKKIRQGQVIGYVGNTGRATGPHLDYRVKLKGRFVNPLKLKLPRGRTITGPLRADFMEFRERMDSALSSVDPQPERG